VRVCLREMRVSVRLSSQLHCSALEHQRCSSVGEKKRGGGNGAMREGGVTSSQQ
jgi:hypothetical protein